MCEGFVAGFAMTRMDLGDFGCAEPVVILDTLSGWSLSRPGAGLGAALLSQLCVNLAALGIETVETTVSPDTFELLGLLYRAGFGRSPR